MFGVRGWAWLRVRYGVPATRAVTVPDAPVFRPAVKVVRNVPSAEVWTRRGLRSTTADGAFTSTSMPATGAGPVEPCRTTLPWTTMSVYGATGDAGLIFAVISVLCWLTVSGAFAVAAHNCPCRGTRAAALAAPL